MGLETKSAERLDPELYQSIGATLHNLKGSLATSRIVLDQFDQSLTGGNTDDSKLPKETMIRILRNSWESMSAGINYALEEFSLACEITPEQIKTGDLVERALRNKVIADSLTVNNIIPEVIIGCPDTEIYVAPNPLVKVFNNLVGNSVDFMRNSSVRKLTIFSCQNGNFANIFVKDTGKGIPLEIQGKIFDKGFSSRNSSGLGLYLSRKILQRFKGSLDLIDSQTGIGSMFLITLPVVK